MPQENTNPNQSNIPPRTGSGKKYKTDEELELERIDAEYEKQQGATGIAGTGKRANPAYKKGLDEFRKKRRGITAKDAGDALAKSTEEKK